MWQALVVSASRGSLFTLHRKDAVRRRIVPPQQSTDNYGAKSIASPGQEQDVIAERAELH